MKQNLKYIVSGASVVLAVLVVGNIWYATTHQAGQSGGHTPNIPIHLTKVTHATPTTSATVATSSSPLWHGSWVGASSINAASVVAAAPVVPTPASVLGSVVDTGITSGTTGNTGSTGTTGDSGNTGTGTIDPIDGSGGAVDTGTTDPGVTVVTPPVVVNIPLVDPGISLPSVSVNL